MEAVQPTQVALKILLLKSFVSAAAAWPTEKP